MLIITELVVTIAVAIVVAALVVVARELRRGAVRLLAALRIFWLFWREKRVKVS